MELKIKKSGVRVNLTDKKRLWPQYIIRKTDGCINSKFESKGIIQHFIFLRMAGNAVTQAKASSEFIFIKAKFTA